DLAPRPRPQADRPLGIPPALAVVPLPGAVYNCGPSPEVRMIAVLLAAALLAQVSEPSETDILKKQVQDLRAEVERLKKELAATQGDAEQLEKFSKEAAEEIGRLRARIKDLEKTAASTPATSPTASASPSP